MQVGPAYIFQIISMTFVYKNYFTNINNSNLLFKLYVKKRAKHYFYKNIKKMNKIAVIVTLWH